MIACLLASFAALASCGRGGAGRPPRAEGGVIDLRSWDFGRRGPVTLSGEWAFAPLGNDGLPSGASSLREVPDHWSGSDAGAERGMGYASYRLTVLLPEGCGELGLRNRTMATAFALYADGRLVDEAGKAGPSPETSVPEYDADCVYLNGLGRELVIEARVSNWEYRTGGMWYSLVLGDRLDMEIAKRYSDMATLILLGVLVAMGSNAIVHYLFRRKEPSQLWFGLFVLVVALRTVVTGEYLFGKMFPGIPFGAVIRLEYLTAIAAPPLFTLYFGSFFPFALPKRPRFALAALSAPFLLALPFMPLPLLTRTVYGIYAVLVVQAVSTAFLHFTRVLPVRRWDGVVLVAGGVLLFGAVGNDVLFSSFRLPTFDMIPLGLVAFISAQAFIQARRTNGAFKRAESLAAELSEANGLLQGELAANDEARKRLESLVAEKDLLIREVNHRVKNSLQVVSSIIALQERRSSGEGERAALAALGTRIRSIGLVHEMLYGAVSADRIDLGAFLRELVGLLERSYGTDPVSLAFDQGIDRLSVPIDFCVDMGLILNELVSNACKHGRSKGGCPRIDVALRGGRGRVSLEIRDDGRGFPEGFDPEKASGLGFMVARALARRRKGGIACSNDPATGGAVVELSFALEEREGSRVPGRTKAGEEAP